MLYQADFNERWLNEAEKLADQMHKLFNAGGKGGYFYTDGGNNNKLISRSRNFQDSALPNGNATACFAYLRLFALSGKTAYRQRAGKILDAASAGMKYSPRAFMKLLRCSDILINGSREIIIAGKDEKSAQDWLQEARLAYHPGQVIVLVTANTKNKYLLAKQMIDGKTTAYVCRDQSCKLPVNEIEAFKKSIGRVF